MNKRRTNWIFAALLFCSMAALPGCSKLVDEDLSDCDNEHRIDYQVCLITNMNREIADVLDKEKDKPVETALRAFLEPKFTDIAHDVTFSFYGDGGALSSTSQETMDKSAFSCSWRLPRGNYRHLCLANLAGNDAVALEGADQAGSARIAVRQPSGEGAAAPSLTSCIFTGRGSYESRYSEQDTPGTLELYAANAATALVLETKEATGIGTVTVRMAGMAGAYNVADNTFVFGGGPDVAATQLPVSAGTQQCFAALHLPSQDTRVRSVSEPEGYFDAPASTEPVWTCKVYVPLADGKITESVLEVKVPVIAGQLKILKANVKPDGSLGAEDPTVGVSVTLDWNEGWHGEVPL